MNLIKKNFLALFLLISGILLVIASFVTTTNTLAHSSINLVDLDNILIDPGELTSPAPGSNYSREFEYDHDGLDLWDKHGSDILAVADGQVIHVQDTLYKDGGYGYYILLKHDLKQRVVYSLYAHLAQAPTYNPGDKVLQGEVIAKMGNTGNSTGTHLHFALFDSIALDQDGNLAYHPTCLKKYGKYAVKCISPYSPPVSITNYIWTDNKSEYTSNPTFTSSEIITLQTIKTEQNLTYKDLSPILLELFIDSRECSPSDNQTPTQRIYDCSQVYDFEEGYTLRKESETITREELASIIIQSVRYNSKGRSNMKPSVGFSDLNDVDSDNIHYASIQRVIQYGILEAPKGEFYPGNVVNREQAAQALIHAGELII